VIRRYWKKDRDHIRVLLNRHNVGRQALVRGYQAARGQYVAIVEGDDYWTSPDKLQRQVDFLDSHPHHTICFHSVRMVWEDGSHEPLIYRPSSIRETYTLRDLLDANFIGSCSTVYRRGVFGDYPGWFYLMPVGDWCHHILHAQHGDIGYIDEPMAVYRQHSAGIYSMKPAVYRLRIAVEMLRRFRCVLPRECLDPINTSLGKAYCALVHQYCDEARRGEARQCLRECFHELRLGRHLPVAKLLKAAARVYTPGLHRLCKQVIGARKTLPAHPHR
jgi:glycosyltransferase involved in cell wall biosynthesis